MLTRKDLKISTDGADDPEEGGSRAGVGARREDGGKVLSREFQELCGSFSFCGKTDLPEGVTCSPRYERDASCPVPRVGGEVGEGIFGEGWPGEVAGCEPFIALRLDEESTARSAALAGSKAVSIDRS